MVKADANRVYRLRRMNGFEAQAGMIRVMLEELVRLAGATSHLRRQLRQLTVEARRGA
jgi:hypothetical protein